jgi:ABC-type amino acid transport system permease subunit
MDSVIADLDRSGLYQTPVAVHAVNSTIQASTCPWAPGFDIGILLGLLSKVLSYITVWRLFIFVLVLGNLKNVPLIWHVSTTTHPQLSGVSITLT